MACISPQPEESSLGILGDILMFFKVLTYVIIGLMVLFLIMFCCVPVCYAAYQARHGPLQGGDMGPLIRHPRGVYPGRDADLQVQHSNTAHPSQQQFEQPSPHRSLEAIPAAATSAPPPSPTNSRLIYPQ